MSLTTDQIEERRTMITASDVSAIVGLNPYRGPLEVYLEKRGEMPPEEMDPARAARIEWGHLLEPHLRRRYAARHGVHVEEQPTLRHPEIRHHGATPDGIVRGSRGWEGKTHSVGLRHLYGPPGTDEVPIHELIQCEWGMHVTGLMRWDLTAFLDGAENDYVIERDDGLIDQLVERVDEWWSRHVVAGERPAPTEKDAEAIKRLYPGHTRDELVIADEADRATIALLETAIRNLSNAEDVVERLKVQLKDRIGEASGITWAPGAAGKITWRKAADGRSVVTDWAGWRTAVQLAASAPAIERFMRILNALPPHFAIEGGTEVESVGGLANALHAMLAAIAREPDTTSTVTRAGSRRFNTPRSWKRAGDPDADQ
jgi:putative phage-type endonuclease